jgi:hypothetical protein
MTEPAGVEAGRGGAITIPVTVDVMVTVAVEVLLRSVVDSAVTTTVFFAGTPGGATKMEVAPLAVWLGKKVPQLGALPHIATQSIPALAGSLVAVAETAAMLPAIKEAGGNTVIATETMGVRVPGSAALVLHPAKTPIAAKLHKIARNAPIQSFRRHAPSVLS